MKINKNDEQLLNILSKKKVLYAEDELGVARNIIDTLELFFDDVVYVQDGLEAFDEFIYNQYDVLIFDICMPNLDGLDLIKKIREINHKIPIVVLTAFSQQEYLWRAIDLKITKYLTKPYSIDTFIEALKNVAMELTDYNVNIQLTQEHTYNFMAKTLCHKDGEVRLSRNESKLLEYMLQRKNQVVSFDDLYDYIWQNSETSKEALKSVIKELRRKLGKDFIKNIYGIGYILEI